MVVVRKGRLSIFSKESIRDAQRDTETMKNIAQEQERIATQLRSTRSRSRGTTTSQSSNFLNTGGQSSNLPRSTVRAQQRLDEGAGGRIQQTPAFDRRAPRIESVGAGAPTAQLKNLQARVTFNERVIAAVQARQTGVFGAIGTIQGGNAAIGNSALGAVRKAFWPVAIASIVVPIVYDALESAHSRGGQNDPSLRETRSAKSLIGLEREDAINGADFLWLGNPTLRQGVPPNSSNTSDLKASSRRYTLTSNPYGR